MKHSDQTQTVTIAGIAVQLTRKDIRHAYLRVKRQSGVVALSVPWAMPDTEVIRIVQEKTGWIRRQLQKPVPPTHTPERTFINGDSLRLWGRSYPLHIIRGSRFSMELTAEAAFLAARENSTPKGREAFAREWARECLKVAIPPLLQKWEGITGLRAAGFGTRDMKTRWGTCNTKTRILWFGLQLVKQPPECLDYVVLHELLHLAERSHGKRFYALLTRYMPDWKQVRAILNGR